MRQSQVAWWGGIFLRCFFTGALAVLAVTALSKGVGASADVRVLAHADPLLGMFTNRQTMLLAVLLEVVIIGLVVWEREVVWKAAYIAWIGSVFLAYRVGLWATGYQGSCGCLGHFSDTFGVSPGILDMLSSAMLAYLLIGSYAILVWKAVSHVRARRGGSLATAG